MQFVMNKKWELFGYRMFCREFLWYLILITVFMIPNTVLEDNKNWFRFTDVIDIFTGLLKLGSWLLAAQFLLITERQEMMSGIQEYFTSGWNWINLSTYVLILASIPLEFWPQLAEAKACVLGLACLCLWLNVLQFLQMLVGIG